LSDTEPSGADLSFDPEFEALKLEVEKLERVDSGPPKWDVVERGADRLLLERTRDLRLVVWSAAAKASQRGWAGLAEGLAQYVEVTKACWDTMHPPAKRLRARANLHEWFLEQVTGAVESRDVDVREADAVRSADRLLRDLDAELSTKFGDTFAGSGRLLSLIRRLLPSLPSAVVAPAPEPIAPPTNTVHNTQFTQTGATPSAGANVADRMRAAVDVLLGTAATILRDDPADARGYRMRRMGMALRAEHAAAAPDPPTTERRERLAELDQKQRFVELLGLAEEALLDCPMWLDAHRHAVEAMIKLGPRYFEARDIAIKEALSLFVRIPGVLSRRFSDGQPIASARTHEWLESEMRRATTSLVVSSEDTELERRFEEARRLASEGRATDAVSLAVGLANRAGDERGRFQGQLLAGKIAVEAGHPGVARPLLEGLLQAVERHQLEVWEPRLCVTLYGSLLACLKALDAFDDRGRELFDKLCKLDPAAAMRIGSG
jgi:type VI secretion system protein VasJ